MLRGGIVVVLAASLLSIASVASAGEIHGLKVGQPDIKMAGPLTFGPHGVLFIGDSNSAAVFAIDTDDSSGHPDAASLNIKGLDQKIAGLLGAGTADIVINDMAVNPLSGNAYFSVMRGQGPHAAPVIIRAAGDGELSEVSLENIAFAKAALPNAPAPGGEGRRNRRVQTITDLAFVDGRVIVSGLSNEEFASKLRAIPFPFQDAGPGTSVEIYHGAHGKLETHSPVRTFVPFDINGKPHVVAAYTCTPLVTFPVATLQQADKVRGKTVAELGNRNTPLDMISYKQDGKTYLLIANTARGVMKVSTTNIDSVESIDERVSGGGTAGLTYDTIEELNGVVQLDKLNDGHALVLMSTDDGMNLKTVALP